MEHEIKTKIILEGEKEYKDAFSNMRKSVGEFREEVEQLNVELEKQIELLKKLG